ncbi:MAG: SMC family ATPase [Candidatus Methylarchaceae archaeon HK01M]|nr:SMC family ATPase [Candidatus Methylarchaceae archaeon HK01M]
MILKNLILNNIRSYGQETQIDFSKGSSLFEGDIGSGKSSILLSIEFALFGLGDVEGTHLLRSGKKEGSVELTFEVNDKEYIVFRSLQRKRKHVNQKDCYIIEDGVRTDYSVTEMKARVLEILDFKEREHPRTSSLIYRYAIFTPQEMMKEVLLQKPDKRLETLRRAFGIEKYSSARNNVDIINGEIKTEIRVLAEAIKDLSDLKILLKDEKANLKRSEGDFNKACRKVKKLNKTVEKIEKNLEGLQPKKEKVIRLGEAIPLLDADINSKEDQELEVKRRIERLQGDLEEILEASQQLKKLRPVYKDYLKKKTKQKALDKSVERYRKLEKRKAGLDESIRQEEKHLEKKIKDLHNDIKSLKESIAKRVKKLGNIVDMEQEEVRLTKEIKPLDGLLKEITKLIETISENKGHIKTKQTELSKKKRELEDIKKIGVGALCPRCKQELTPEHYNVVEGRYDEELAEIMKTIKSLIKTVKSLRKEKVKLEKDKGILETKRDKLVKLGKNLAELKERASAVDIDRKKLDDIQKELDSCVIILEEQGFAKKKRKELGKVMKSLERLKNAKEGYDSLKQEIEKLETQRIEANYTESESKSSRKSRVSKDLCESKGALKKLQKEIKLRKKEIQKKTQLFGKDKIVLEEINKLEDNKTNVNKQLKQAEKESTSIEERINSTKTKIREIQESILQKEKHLIQKEIFEEMKVWLNDYFVPCLQDIEIHVLINIKEEFDQLFQYWFNSLTETDDISVRIDDSFTPIIEQGGYELEVGSLSGGERTTVALAYRLALNVMVKMECKAMYSNLLILDEPTDGFSKEQLNKLRDVLRELNCEQVIMVSHERELEGFVDQVYRITKERGISKVQRVLAS